MEFGKGWSITVAEMKEAIKDVPDDYEIVMDNAEVDECEIASVTIADMYPPALGAAGLVVLRGGQVISAEYDYHVRLDASFDFPSDSWNDREWVWKRE